MSNDPRRTGQIIVFVPEGQRKTTEVPIDLQDKWVMKLLHLCSKLFGGATAYGRGIGVWMPARKRNPETHWDRVTVIECWVDPDTSEIEQRVNRLARNLKKMRRELRQKEVAAIIDGVWKSYR